MSDAVDDAVRVCGYPPDHLSDRAKRAIYNAYRLGKRDAYRDCSKLIRALPKEEVITYVAAMENDNART